MKGLHKGLFANWFLRVLLLFMGIGGTAMIGTGLLLWANARRTRLLAAKQPLHFGIWLVDRLNVGTMVGMPIAIAAYFWANRLLPVAMAIARRLGGARDVPDHGGDVRLSDVAAAASARAWRCCGCARRPTALLPVLNALTTTRHLGHSMPQGDWIMAGFDLAALGCGAVAADLCYQGAAQRRHCHRASPAGRRRDLSRNSRNDRNSMR